jgi:hypothetical protein
LFWCSISGSRFFTDKMFNLQKSFLLRSQI